MTVSRRTHCPYCSFQCGVVAATGTGSAGSLFPAPDTVQLAPDAGFPVNRGRWCVKGMTAADLLDSPDRLRRPLVRDRFGRLRPCDWDTALDEAARRLAAVRDRYGADANAVFGSGALINETAYLLGKFARLALGTANVDYNGRYCMSSAAAAQNLAFGIDRGLPFPVSDIADTDVLLLWGSNCVDTMPPVQQWLQAQRARGGTLIVVDPRRTPTAQAAQVHLQLVPGRDVELANGLLHIAVAERLIDTDYIAARTVGFDAVRRAVLAGSPTAVERSTGISVRDQIRVVRALAEAPSAMLLSGRGPEQQARGVDAVLAFTNLMLALGRVGRPASGYGCLTGQANGQGGREHGQKADQLPGYRSITDPADRAAVARVWGIDPDRLPGPGRSAFEILGSLGDGGVRGLLVMGSDVATASPDVARVRRGLAELDCLVVADLLPNDTMRYAHVVLPVAQWAEQEGTTTNLEGRVVHRRRLRPVPAGVRTDLEILCGLAERLGAGHLFAATQAEAVFEELRAVTQGSRADYAGISYERIDAEQGVFWPCPSPSGAGTARMFTDRFAHPDGRARFVALLPRPGVEEPDEEFPLYFTTGRLRDHYNSGTQTRRTRSLRDAAPRPRIELHPLLADRLGIRPEEMIRVESRRGSIVAQATITPDIRPDTVFAPFHWGGDQAANLLTDPTLDPVSRMPAFKVCAVRVCAARAAASRTEAVPRAGGAG